MSTTTTSTTTTGTTRRPRPQRAAALGSLALMASAIGSGGLTFVFWTVVARRYGPATVGTVSSQVATITFLGGAASLNMINVLARFLPVAGRSSRRFVALSYLTAACAALVVSVVFLTTPWADTYVAPAPVFVLLVMLTGIFLIQDGALVGLGRPGWVPAENVAVGAGRLALLPALGLLATSSAGAVLGAWGVSLAAAVIVVNLAVLLRLAPAQTRTPALPPAPQLRRFIAIESVNTAISSAVTTFLPAIVTNLYGASVGGYFYVPWLVAATVFVLLTNILITAVRESVADPAAAPRILTGQLRLGAVLVGLVMACCSIVPQLPLALLGSSFADHASGLLRWIGLATPGTAVGLLYWAVCLLRQRPWPMLALNLAITGGTLAGVVLLRDAVGLTGIGLVYFAVQTATGLAVLVPLVRTLRPILRPKPGPTSDSTPPGGRR